MAWFGGRFGKREDGGQPEPELQTQEPVVDYDGLLRELLTVELRREPVTTGGVKGWLMLRRVTAGALAERLPEFWGREGAVIGVEPLRVLVGLRLEPLSGVARQLLGPSENHSSGASETARQPSEAEGVEDDAAAWFNQGNQQYLASNFLGAIQCYDQALAIKPDDHEAWYNRGVSLHALGRLDEAIASFDQALAIKPDDHVAWSNRGISLAALGRLDEAIASYDQALAIKPDYHEAWANRSSVIAQATSCEPFSAAQRFAFGFAHPSPALLAFLQQPPTGPTLGLTTCGYPGQLQTLNAGLTHCPAPTYGHGILQRWLGDAHLNQAKTQQSPRPLWRAARTAYNAALIILTATDHPQDHLKTLQALIRTHLALGDLNEASITALLRQGSDLRDSLLNQAPSDAQRQRLDRDLPNFRQLTCDHHLRQGDIPTALATAEQDKNALLQWLLAAAGATSLEIDLTQLQQQLPTHRAILYWHHSPNAITTFVLSPLRRGARGEVQPTALSPSDPQAALAQVTQLETWLKTWNEQYQAHIDASKTPDLTTAKTSQPIENSSWYINLPQSLGQLAAILRIDDLKALLPDGVTQLMLIPHRDLHRLPLQTFFLDYETTTLPSLQLGQLLRPALNLAGDATINLAGDSAGDLGQTNGGSSLRGLPTALNVTAPHHDGLAPLYHAEAESALIARLLNPSHTVHSIPAHQASHTTVQQALGEPHQILHFNGHAFYNFADPKQSALALTGQDRLTVQDLLPLNLRSYSLVSLASCETALSGNQTITSEYVGLTSALLAQGIPHILSTLWTVESAASMVFMAEFYSHLHLGPVAAYHHSRHILPRLTISDLRSRYQQWLTLALPALVRELLTEELEDLNPADTIDPQSCPYRHPYYWSAFVLTGAAA